MSRGLLRSLAALAAAALLAVLALEVLRWERRITGDDLRFAAAPASERLWRPTVLVPGDGTQRLLGLGDDVEYRRTLRRFWPVRPGQAVMGPELETIRGGVESDLARNSRASADGAARSHMLNLLGVLTIGRYYGSAYGTQTSAPGDAAERGNVLRTTIGLFQAAVEADGANADAKDNLELLLRDPGARAHLDIVDTPEGSAAEGRGTGAGRGGSGY